MEHSVAIVSCARDDQTNPHIEGPQHVVVGHTARSRQPCEEWRDTPRTTIDDRTGACGENARKVLGDASAGDVRHALDAAAVEQRAADPIDDPTSGTIESGRNRATSNAILRARE
jgi:hypothetical protein